MHQFRLFKAMACSAVTLTLALVASPVSAAPLLKLEKGDHICIVGNTLADLAQHDGWLETYIYASNPDLDLVIRNLGYSGDEVSESKRIRSANFGKPDEWLAGSSKIPQPTKIGNPKDVDENRFEQVNTKADVIFAFFGYNESYAGAKGLPQFKKELDQLLKHYAEARYNGKSAPKVVLFSPIAHEDLKNPDLPDGKANNENLKLYTAAMAEVAKANDVPFVDLFTISEGLYAKAKAPLTNDGVHLVEEGYHQLAPEIDTALFGSPTNIATATLDAVHKAVVDKAWHWFYRYRTTDGFSTYGDRAFLQFTEKQSNYEVLQRELKVLDIMVQNRDKAIWGALKGQPVAKIDDSNAPPFLEVKTNKPNSAPYVSGEDAMKMMTVAKGLKVSLFADESKFPDLINPVQMSFDTKGRLWVATWPSYPHWQPGTAPSDKLLILEDTDGDGKADKCTVFAGDLMNPTGFEFYNGGVIVAQGPDIWFMKDTDGDDKVDVRVRIIEGVDTTDTHHTANSFTFDPGGALYFQEGTFMNTQLESPWAPTLRNQNAAVYRFEPRTYKTDVYTAYGYANPHGHVFDKWGTDIITDATGADAYFGPAYSGHLDYPNKHGGAPHIYRQRTRPCPGTEMLSGTYFPPEMQGNFIVANVIGFQGLLSYKLTEKGAGLVGTEMMQTVDGKQKPDPMLTSTDPNFRPSDLEVAPDGTLYFTDWQNSIIGHMQHNLRDPTRDKQHGRIYRITCPDRPLLKPATIAGASIENLLELLKSPEERVVYRAKIELSARPTKDVMEAVTKWAAALDKKDPNYEYYSMQALWLHQWHNVVDLDLLNRMLKSPEPHARAAATRVLCYWRDRVPNAVELLATLAQDENARVSLEAVRACSFFGADKADKATEAALGAVEKHEKDPVLKYTLDETMKQLEAVQKSKK